jgi:hypothetical protein
MDPIRAISILQNNVKIPLCLTQLNSLNVSSFKMFELYQVVQNLSYSCQIIKISETKIKSFVVTVEAA